MTTLFEVVGPSRHPSPSAQDATAPAASATGRRATAGQAPAGPDLREEMAALHYQIDALLPERTKRTVQFIASRDGEGTSTVAYAFARVNAVRFRRRVLLLEFEPGMQAGGGTSGMQPDDATLAVAPFPHELTRDAALHAGPIAEAWARLCDGYDLIVIDSPPASRSPEALAIVSHVDGVVLVLEAEHTRWPVAARAKEGIVRSGGRLLGVVLNKRRHYIPSFVYNWL